jgi:hypothetical protein
MTELSINNGQLLFTRKEMGDLFRAFSLEPF